MIETLPKKLKKRGIKPGQVLPKTTAALQLMDAGIGAREALQITNLKKNISASTVCKLKNKYIKHSLTQPVVVKSAYSQVRRILQSEPREAIKYRMDGETKVAESIQEILPSDTNILAAASMVYDRYEPVVQQSVHVDMIIHPVDLSEYARPASLQVEESQAIEAFYQVSDHD